MALARFSSSAITSGNDLSSFFASVCCLVASDGRSESSDFAMAFGVEPSMSILETTARGGNGSAAADALRFDPLFVAGFLGDAMFRYCGVVVRRRKREEDDLFGRGSSIYHIR